MKYIYLILVVNASLWSIAGLSAQECKRFSSIDYAEAERNFLAHHTKVTGVTALHVAAATGDLQGIQAALDSGIHINTQDSRKFTAAHFAALREDSAALDYLKIKGANLKLRNMWHAGAADFYHVVHLADPKIQRINMWDDNLQSMTQVDGNQFCELVGATFIEGIKMNPANAMQMWLDGESMEKQPFPEFSKYHLDASARFGSYENLYIKRVYGKDKSALGFGLFAQRDFKAGEIISVYEGEWLYSGQNAEYTLGNIDATHLRGYLGFAADGAPNVMVMGLPHRLGVPRAGYSLTVEPIKKDEAVMWDYGQHDIKWEMYAELAPNKVTEYLGDVRPAQWLEKNRGRTTFDLSGLREMGIVGYVSNTPIVFSRLALDGTISYHDLIALHALRGTIGQLPQEMMALLIQGVGAVRRSPEALRFLLAKTNEGNASVLLNTLINLGRNPKTTYENAVSAWNLVQRQICAQPSSSMGNRGGCRLLKASLDEL